MMPKGDEMDSQISQDPVLRRFRAALAKTYGDRLERAVLFGSRARGDFRPDSDYDIAVFIRDSDPWFDEVVRLADLGTDILIDTGAVISAKPFPPEAYDARLPLMTAIRGEGLDL
jgi:predicted nucleotidyltransferase